MVRPNNYMTSMYGSNECKCEEEKIQVTEKNIEEKDLPRDCLCTIREQCERCNIDYARSVARAIANGSLSGGDGDMIGHEASRDDLIDLARWINSVNGCVSQAEKTQFYEGALKYFVNEFEAGNMGDS